MVRKETVRVFFHKTVAFAKVIAMNLQKIQVYLRSLKGYREHIS